MTKFFQSIRVWSVSASFGAALVMGGVVGSPTGPFAPQAAHAAVSNWDQYLAQVKAEINRGFVRVTAYTVTSSTPNNGGRAYIDFTQVGSYTANGRTYTVTKKWQAVVTGNTYTTRLISTSVQ